LGQAFEGKIALRYQAPGAAGEASASPCSCRATILSIYDRHRRTSSIIAVSRTDRSFVVFRERVGQAARLAW
jgi:hypothetical protein